LLITLRRGVRDAAGIGVAAYLSVCYRLPPSLLRTAATNSQTAGGDYHWSARSLFALVIVIVLFGAAWWVSRRRQPSTRFILLLATLLTTIAFLASYDFNVAPQGLRYHVEMEIPICVLLGFAAERLWQTLPRAGRLALIALSLLLAIYQTGHYWNFARALILPPADVTGTVEYRITRKMESYFGPERVMIAGSPALWANVFSDTRQLAGAHDQFNPNQSLLAAGFIQYGGRDAAKISARDYIVWLEAFGAHGINVPGPASEEPYKPFHANPNLFEGLLPVVDRDRGDTIYRVPQRSDGLAHVVPANAVAHQFGINDAARYVAALNDPSLPLATWRETSDSTATIAANVQPGQLISVQTTYSPGWQVTANGQREGAFRDGLGMLVIQPSCSGRCQFQLRFDGGMETKITFWISLLTITAIAGFLLRATLKVRRAWTPSKAAN
jgi:hypothetical protein